MERLIDEDIKKKTLELLNLLLEADEQKKFSGLSAFMTLLSIYYAAQNMAYKELIEISCLKIFELKTSDLSNLEGLASKIKEAFS